MKSVTNQEYNNNIDPDLAKFECGFRQNTVGSNVNTRSSSRGGLKRDIEFNFETNATENTPNKRKVPHSTKNSMNFFRSNENHEGLSPFHLTLKDNSKFNRFNNIFDEDLSGKKIDQDKNMGYIFSLPNRNKDTQKPVISSSYNMKKDLIMDSDKLKNNKILRSIQTITIDLHKEKKSNNYINRPIVQFDNKAELKIDMNYIIESSPTNVRKNSLVTLEHLHLERLNKKIDVERVPTSTFEAAKFITTNEKVSDKDDSFFDFKVKGIKNVKKKAQHNHSTSQDLFFKKSNKY
jgi:hypothetical protein